jgi:SAM-dependent methyltransferase
VVVEMAIDPHAFNEFEAAGWQQKASGYDAFFAPVTGQVVGPLLDAVGAGAGIRLLDVASGPGYVAAAAARRGAQVTAIDIAPEMVELARRSHPEVDFRAGDAEALPFQVGSFDAVVSNFGILHLGRPEQAAAEFARVLSAGGSVAMSVWDVPGRARLIGVFVDAMTEAGAAPPADVPVGPPFFRFSDDDAFAELLAGAGLIDVAVDTVEFSHRMPSTGALWNHMLAGTVRTAAAIQGQPPDVQARIRTAFDRLAGAHAVGDGLDLPVSVKLATGRKPSAS